MINFLYLSKFEAMFNLTSTVSVIIFIISSLISLAILGVIIFSIIKTVKGVKNGTIKLEPASEDDENSNFTTCEYCGASNKKENTTCEKCGANIKSK